ncbi:hypothetical protein BD311DRAFT_715100 [Dichomitus squalens]|uniref:Ser-Thr-rich glycosyl-phosphatidyl-inositol-anchored membrane family-domain-containing protein n=1 Tax=Dichomitus squalens TaxID=114155 RepID=A0A4Q9MWP2_9APHY|nr:hypothetical protein BD311DRAFT_715100 [Dichomitus squalens]
MHPTLVCFAALLAAASSGVHAQTLVNGQVFTNGLAIVDAPAPGSPMHAGSVTQVAIDISGDGHLDQSASIPGSGKSTRFDSLEIYLVSYQTKQNITVSNGTELLTQEQGSTVKHWNFNVSTCIPAGNYNLTFYEASHIDNQPYFAITAYPVTVQNDNPSGACTNGTNALQDFPQASSPPPQSPWLIGTTIATQPLPTATGNAASSQSIVMSSAMSVIALGALLVLLC